MLHAATYQGVDIVAARAEAHAEIAEAEFQLASLNAAAADSKKQRQAQQTALNAAQKRLAAPTSRHVPISGSRKLLETPAHKTEDYAPIYARTSTGRRLAFARWIADAKNPLTARVAVNHIWLRHFGTPLVESVFDFGLRAPAPRQRELLDFLAGSLIANGWSLKSVHRQILLSAAYRRSSSNLDADSETRRRDPDNLNYWRMNPRRMESQIIRDNLLHLGGTLDPTLGGPALDPTKDSRRRSLYFRHSRDDAERFVTQFDDADFLQCYRRAESIVPQQALAMANSGLALAAARQLANASADRSDVAYVDALFIRVLGRRPDPTEADECSTFLNRSNENRSLLAHALLNHNDFVTIR